MYAQYLLQPSGLLDFVQVTAGSNFEKFSFLIDLYRAQFHLVAAPHSLTTSVVIGILWPLWL